MGLFWIIAVALIVTALLFVLPPLLGRHGHSAPTRAEVSRALHKQRLTELERDLSNELLAQAQYERARRDLEREFLADSADGMEQVERPSRAHTPWTAWLVGISLPALAVGLYVQFSTGSHALMGESSIIASQASEPTAPSMQEMAAAIQARLEQRPDDRTGWIMLARANTLLGRYREASQAYARADRLAELDDPRILAAYAQTLAFANGQQFAGEPLALLNKALELEPNNLHALWLAGWAAFQREDFSQAIDYWERLDKAVPAERRELFADIPDYIAEAQRLARQPSGISTDTGAEAAASAALRVSVQLAPELAERVLPGDTVFIYAQALDGSRVPLALARRTAEEFPLKVTLDDSMAMAPAFNLSSEDQVRVTARVSKSGNAMPTSGDLLGYSAPVSTRSEAQVSITIDAIVP